MEFGAGARFGSQPSYSPLPILHSPLQRILLLSRGDMATVSTTWSSSWFIVGKASISLSSVLISRLITVMFFFRFLQNDMIANISRQIVEITPVMRKSPEKQRKFSVFNSSVRLALLRGFEPPIHFFSILIISSPSVMLRIAFEMSATSGEPLGKACPSIKDQEATPPFALPLSSATAYSS